MFAETKLEIVKKVIASGAIQIQDVDRGEEPFLYSSGNRGPGYIMIKGLCGQPEIFLFLMKALVEKVQETLGDTIDFVNGNVTGGMLPGWEIRNQLSKLRGKEIPYVYLRGSRKEGGHNERITGDLNNPQIDKGMNVLIVEELVNYGETTMNAINVFRKAGYKVTYGACILNYAHADTMKHLSEMGVELLSLITLPEILDVAEENHFMEKHKIQSYRNFLADSIRWQLDRDLVIPEKQATIALNQGYEMIKLSTEEAIKLGAPISKVNAGVVYWKRAEKTRPEKTVFVALDFDDSREVLETSRMLSQVKGKYGFKINLDILLGLHSHALPSYQLIQRLNSLGKPLFVDLKMWNGRRTMCKAVQYCIDLGVDIVNVYPHIGWEALKELVQLTRGTKTKLFVLTVLTHYDDDYCREIYGQDMKCCVRTFAEMARATHADGIILPPTCLDVVKDMDIIKLCPGIRTDKTDRSNHQRQVTTPQEAFDGGADYLVIGTSITKAENMVESLECILGEMNSG